MSRARYRDVGIAQRAMQERLMGAAADLQPVDFRVALAVVSLLTSWSKVEDDVYRSEVAELAGCNEQVAGKSLTRLDALGVLGWVPTKRQKSRSWLGLAPRHETTVVSSSETHETTAVSSHETTVVSLPRSDPEKKAGDPLPPSEHETLARSLVEEHWGHLGKPRRGDVATIAGLMDAGWTLQQVEDVVATHVRDGNDPARTMTALTRRVERLRHMPTHASAMKDPDLAVRLGRRRGARTTNRPSSEAEFGPSRTMDKW